MPCFPSFEATWIASCCFFPCTLPQKPATVTEKTTATWLSRYLQKNNADFGERAAFGPDRPWRSNSPPVSRLAACRCHQQPSGIRILRTCFEQPGLQTLWWTPTGFQVHQIKPLTGTTILRSDAEQPDFRGTLEAHPAPCPPRSIFVGRLDPTALPISTQNKKRGRADTSPGTLNRRILMPSVRCHPGHHRRSPRRSPRGSCTSPEARVRLAVAQTSGAGVTQALASVSKGPKSGYHFFEPQPFESQSKTIATKRVVLPEPV